MKNSLLFFLVPFTFFPLTLVAGNCDYSWQTDSAGRRCGGRAASVRPGGKLGGDGKYIDSYGRQRLYGPNNDIYDRNKGKGNINGLSEATGSLGLGK